MSRRTDTDLLLPYGDILQVKNGAIWETKYVVVSSNDKDPSRILIAFFDNESQWKEGYIGDLAFRCPDALVKEITLYSTARPATKEERSFRGRSRGFVLAVSNAIDPDDVDTVLFNALDEDQKKYWLNMFHLCFIRLQLSKQDSEMSQKEKSGWMPTLTKSSVLSASRDPAMIQFETLQRDGRWIEDNVEDFKEYHKQKGDVDDEKNDKSGKETFQEVPEHLRYYFFHIRHGTEKILEMRRSLFRFFRFCVHIIMFVMLLLYTIEISSTIPTRREMSGSLKNAIDTPFFYNQNELKMIGFSDVSSVDDFLGWMKSTIITNGMFWLDTSNRLENRMLGAMRIRQVRRQEASSSLSSSDTGVTLQSYKMNDLTYSTSISCETSGTYCPDTGNFDWSTADNTKAPPDYNLFYKNEEERFVTVPYSGYIVDLDSSNHTYAFQQIESMRNSTFFEVPHTAMIYVSASFFNPNIDMVWQTEMSFEITSGGKIYPSLYFSLSHGECSDSSSFYFAVLLITVCVNIVFLLFETRILTRSCQEMLGFYVSHLQKKIILMWYFLDVCVSLMIIVSVILMHTQSCSMVNTLSETVSFSPTQFVDFKATMETIRVTRSILAVASFALIFLMFRHIRESRAISSVALVLRESKGELMGFVIVFIIIISCFSLSMRSLLGTELFEFHDFARSLRTFTYFYGVFLDSQDFMVMDSSSYDIYIVLNIILGLVLVSQIILSWLIISIFVERFHSVRKTIRRQTAMGKRAWFDWENSELIRVYAARRILDYVQMAILFPSFYKHIVEAILTNEGYRERLYLTYEELHQIVRNELEHNRYCCGCRCRFNIFEIFMNKDEDADSIVRTIIALQPTNLKCVPSVIRYWALRKEQEEGIMPSSRQRVVENKEEKNDDEDDEDDYGKNRVLDLWTNASKLGLGDVTSRQQIASQWNTRTMRAELIHASVYILRKRDRDRFVKLNRCVRELQRTQRIVEDLVHDLSERVESLTNTKIDIVVGDDDEVDDDEVDDVDDEQENFRDDKDRNNEDEKKAHEEEDDNHDAKVGSKKKKMSEKSGDVALNIDPKNTEDSKADSTSPAVTDIDDDDGTKSSDSKDNEIRSSSSSSGSRNSKHRRGNKKTGVAKALLSGLTSNLFQRNTDKNKKDKFKESARVIQQFQDELNSTVAELQADRILRDAHEKNEGDKSDDEENDSEKKDHDDDDRSSNDLKSSNTASNSNSTTGTQNWKEFGFSREFMKKWQTINRNDPIDQSWDTLNTKLQKHVQGTGTGDAYGVEDTTTNVDSQNNVTKDDNKKKDVDDSDNTEKKKSGWRKFVPFIGNRTDGDEGEVEDEDEDTDMEENTLPDLLNLDQINMLWEKKDDEWREYLVLNRPECLINKRIEVQWEDGFEAGIITQFNRHTRKHTVQYDDGELRRYDLRRKKYRFLIG